MKCFQILRRYQLCLPSLRARNSLQELGRDGIRPWCQDVVRVYVIIPHTGNDRHIAREGIAHLVNHHPVRIEDLLGGSREQSVNVMPDSQTTNTLRSADDGPKLKIRLTEHYPLSRRRNPPRPPIPSSASQKSH